VGSSFVPNNVAASCIPSSRFINAQLSPPESWLSDADHPQPRPARPCAYRERAGWHHMEEWPSPINVLSWLATTTAPSHRMLLDSCKLAVMLAVYY
jgi:hypothetical protein